MNFGGTLFDSAPIYSGSCMAAVLVGGASKFGARAELLGTRRQRMTIAATVCLFHSSTTQWAAADISRVLLWRDAKSLAALCAHVHVSVGPLCGLNREVVCRLVSPAEAKMPMGGNPHQNSWLGREAHTQALFCLVLKLGGWGEESCRLKSNHISDAFQLCSICFFVKYTHLKLVFCFSWSTHILNEFFMELL